MRVALRTSPVNARDFRLPEKMSPRLEDFYRRALERFSAGSVLGSKAPAVVPKLSTRVIVNGQEFAGSSEMPPEYRRFYEQILASAVPLDRAIYLVARTEHSNFIGRIISLLLIAGGVAGAIVYLWLHGYYG